MQLGEVVTVVRYVVGDKDKSSLGRQRKRRYFYRMDSHEPDGTFVRYLLLSNLYQTKFNQNLD